MEEEQEDADWGDPEPTPLATPLEPATTNPAHGLDPSSSTTWGPCEQPPQPTPAAPEEAPAAVEEEAIDFFKGSTSAHSVSPPTSDHDWRY